MTQVPGLDTIRNLVGQPPSEIIVEHKVLRNAQLAMSAINQSFIALIPYCYKCKVPLAWHQEPREKGHEDEIFTCPNCGRVWVRGERQNDKTKKDS